MSQYHLPMGSFEDGRTFAALDSFVQGYIEAMFFTDASDLDDGELADASFADLAPETLTKCIEDCAKFRASLPKDGSGRDAVDLACDYAPDDYDEQRAGTDFWFTRNRHGAGFWDRELGVVGDELTNAAHTVGEISLYRGDDGLIYFT